VRDSRGALANLEVLRGEVFGSRRDVVAFVPVARDAIVVGADKCDGHAKDHVSHHEQALCADVHGTDHAIADQVTSVSDTSGHVVWAIRVTPSAAHLQRVVGVVVEHVATDRQGDIRGVGVLVIPMRGIRRGVVAGECLHSAGTGKARVPMAGVGRFGAGAGAQSGKGGEEQWGFHRQVVKAGGLAVRVLALREGHVPKGFGQVPSSMTSTG
jgi:hypothetical protein